MQTLDITPIFKHDTATKNSFANRACNKTFSLLLPSRKRVPYLKKLCASIATTAYDTNDIEVIVACDDDDIDTKTAKINFPWIKILSRPRVRNISAYFNWMYLHSAGKYIWVMNDDMEILTDNWDAIAKEKLDSFQAYSYGRIRHNGWNEANAWSPFPIVSRAAVDCLGYLMDERQPGWSADSYLYKVYLSANCICDLPEIKVNHSGIDDETHKNINSLSANGCDTTNYEPDVEKLIGNKQPVKAQVNESQVETLQEIKRLLGKINNMLNKIANIETGD